MRSESEAFRAMYRELDDLRAALLDARRQLAALRTERKMQEARKREISYLHSVARAAIADADSLRDELAKRADAQDVEACRKRILDMDQVIENWRNAYNTDIAMAAGQVRRLTAERNEARAQAESADIELNQVRQEVTTLKTELSEARRSLKAVTRDLDALLRAAQSKSVRTVEETMAGQAGVLATLAPHDRSAPPTTDPLASVHARIDAVAADVQSLWNMLGRHADAIAELRGKEGDNG